MLNGFVLLKKKKLKMANQKIENLIIKYVTNEANSDDLDVLSKWILIDDNEKFFETYIRIHFKVTSAMSKPDLESLKDNFIKKIKKDKNPYYKYKIPSLLRYAALLTIVFGLGYLYQKPSVDSLVVQENILIPKEESITLTLDDGTVQSINPEENNTIKDAKGNVIGSQNKSKLTYQSSKSLEELVYNTLYVPRGKKFDLILSDGTRVFINSDTSIKYPVKFLNNGHRDVFITGEAYFDVAKDESHPFVVHAGQMKVKVLGTKFNVTHYSENKNIKTVLVEGSVELFSSGTKTTNMKASTILEPGFKAEWNKLDHQVEIENVDTRVYTAWIDGKLIFRNTSFNKITKTLERRYNVVIENHNKDLDAQLFDATFDVETINEILETFSKSYAIEYSIVDNKAIIN